MLIKFVYYEGYEVKMKALENRKKELEGKIINVYASTYHISAGFGDDSKNERMFYIDTLDGELMGVGLPIKNLAEDLIYLAKAQNRRVKLNYRGELSKITEVLDGYFGRPEVLAGTIGLRCLNNKEIKTLRGYIKKLNRKEGINNLLA